MGIAIGGNSRKGRREVSTLQGWIATLQCQIFALALSSLTDIEELIHLWSVMCFKGRTGLEIATLCGSL